MADHVYTYDDPPSEKDIRRAVHILENHGVIAYPTECNWAFGCDAASSKALDRIRALKPSHPRDRPFALLCASVSMASEVGNIDNTVYRFIKKAWPGPYTVLLPSTRSLPKQIKDKRRVVGVRVPDSRLLQALIEALGRPLATTSVPAIPPHDETGQPPRFGYEVMEVFGHALDLILDLGSELPGLESTVVDFTEGLPQVVREGVGDPKIFDI